MLQRKPANRLGLRGGQEVKDHAWLKYYPWKDLYEKKLESPFIPKAGDNFDAKYCNTPEKIGNDTRAKYESYIREESFKDIFKDFYYYFNEYDPNDKNNTTEKKFFNPHLNMTSNYSTKNFNNVDANSTNSSLVRGSGDKSSNMNILDVKFSKIKMMSASGSTSSLLRHYRQSSGHNISSNSTSSSNSLNNNILHRKSGSQANLHY